MARLPDRCNISIRDHGLRPHVDTAGGLTYVFPAFGNTQPAQEFHASTVGQVHFRPLCHVVIALDECASCAIPRQLQRSEKAGGPGADDQAVDLMIHCLHTARLCRFVCKDVSSLRCRRKHSLECAAPVSTLQGTARASAHSAPFVRQGTSRRGRATSEPVECSSNCPCSRIRP